MKHIPQRQDLTTEASSLYLDNASLNSALEETKSQALHVTVEATNAVSTLSNLNLYFFTAAIVSLSYAVIFGYKYFKLKKKYNSLFTLARTNIEFNKFSVNTMLRHKTLIERNKALMQKMEESLKKTSANLKETHRKSRVDPYYDKVSNIQKNLAKIESANIHDKLKKGAASLKKKSALAVASSSKKL